MTEPTTDKPKGALVAIGVLVVVGVVLIVANRRSAPDIADPDAPDAEAPQQFDIATDPKFAAGVPLRDIDRDIFAAMQDPALKRERMTDLFPDRPYRVRLMGSGPQHRYSVVTIDNDRDGKPEERWDLRNNQVTRIVPHDPNAPDSEVKYTLSHGRWQPH